MSKLLVDALRHTGASSDGVTLDSSGNVTFAGNATCSGTATGFGGITEIDTWRINTTFSSTAEPITANWERDDTYGNGKLGTGITESSGVFTFPSTGFWRVTFNGWWNNDNSNNDVGTLGGIQYTSNAGTNWISAAYQQGSIYGGEANDGEGNFNVEKIFDITDVSNHKIRFAVWTANSNTKTVCNTNENRTYATFIKLADT